VNTPWTNQKADAANVQAAAPLVFSQVASYGARTVIGVRTAAPLFE